MDSLNSRQFISIFKTACKKMTEKYIEKLRVLDASIGDGDLGITINKGNTAVVNYLDDLEEKDIGKILKMSGMEFNEANPSTFGVFTATAFMKGGGAVKGKESLDLKDIKDIFIVAKDGIIDKGGAELGDKTMIDALHPAVEELKNASAKELSIEEAIDNACSAAEIGMKNTIDMKAQQGRAHSFGERTIGEQDPGATVVFYFLKEIGNAIAEQL